MRVLIDNKVHPTNTDGNTQPQRHEVGWATDIA
jgi:hypothetical protein